MHGSGTRSCYARRGADYQIVFAVSVEIGGDDGLAEQVCQLAVDGDIGGRSGEVALLTGVGRCAAMGDKRRKNQRE